MLKCCRLCTLAGGNFRWGKTESVIDFFLGGLKVEKMFFWDYFSNTRHKVSWQLHHICICFFQRCIEI